MKITQQRLKQIIEEEIADAAVQGLKQLLNRKPVLAVFNQLKKILDAQGKPGSSNRKEEIAAVLGRSGITAADLIKIVSGMKGEESRKQSQETSEV